jgi:hypothetical protein
MSAANYRANFWLSTLAGRPPISGGLHHDIRSRVHALDPEFSHHDGCRLSIRFGD